MTDDQRRERYLAVGRAKRHLRPGDRLYVERCGGRRVTVTFRGWDGLWISTPTLDDVSPWNVLRVNGKPHSFRAALLPSIEAELEREAGEAMAKMDARHKAREAAIAAGDVTW